jgi:multiple sugar transport system permease protein
VLIGVPTIFMAFFLGAPVVRAIEISLSNRSLTGPLALHPQNVGLQNYHSLFTSGIFWGSLKSSLEYLVGSAIIGQIAIGFLIAVFMQRLPKLARRGLLALIIVAWVIPEIVTAFIWSGYLSTPNGLVNELLGAIGVGPVSFLYKESMPSLIIANFWRGTAFSVLVLSAALDAIDSEILEAARLDGAGEWDLLRRIRVPLMRTPIATVLALATLWTLSDFTLIFVLTNGGPGYDTYVLPIYTYMTSFDFYQLGLGTAASFVLLLLACGLAYFYVRVAGGELRTPRRWWRHKKEISGARGTAMLPSAGTGGRQ